MSTGTDDTSPRSSQGEEKKSALPPIPPRKTHTRNASQNDVPTKASLVIPAAEMERAVTLPIPASTANAPSVAEDKGIDSASNWLTQRTYEPREVAFNGDGNVTGGTLRCLIERMTLHDATIDAAFSNTFFLTFRMFTTSSDLTDALIDRFDVAPPAGVELSEEDSRVFNDQKLVPVRLRVYNLFKTWLENHWRPETDAAVLNRLNAFTRERMLAAMPGAAQRLLSLIQKRLLSLQDVMSPTGNEGPRTESFAAGGPTMGLSGSTVGPPTPAASKSLLAALRQSGSTTLVHVTELDPLELARQLTIMESKLYCAIRPEELLGQEFSKKSSSIAVNVKGMSSLSTKLTGWIAEVILDEQDAKKRSALVKFFIKVGARCLSMNNFNTLMAIIVALNSSTISRLKKTWEGLSNKYRLILESLRKATEHTRNYAQYRATLRTALPPCLPFLGLYLTDLTFCHEGNQPFRNSPLDPNLKLINFDRYHKIAKIVNDLQRFQVPYNLAAVPEIQTYITTSLANVQNGGDVGALYRRSLAIEPRQPGTQAPHQLDDLKDPIPQIRLLGAPIGKLAGALGGRA